MATPGFLSKRVRKKSQTGLTTDRYEFLGLDQAEPDLGDPLVGLSSVGANPPPIVGNQYVLTAYENQTGKRYWTAAAQITGSGLIPGSFTVFDNNVQVGAANSFNRFNFVGNGVSVDPVGTLPGEQTGIATIRITVSDVVAPGNLNSIPYKASNGFLAGATDFVYSSGNIGIGTTIPTTKLDIVGNVRVSGVVTATTFNGQINAGVSTISVNSSTDALRITQTGSGNALIVEDESNPDATPFVIGQDGNVGVGTNVPSSFYNLLVQGNNAIQIGNSDEPVQGNSQSSVFKGLIIGYDSVSKFNYIRSWNKPLHLINGYGKPVYIANDVGIGTTNPTSTLHVDGNVLVSGISTFTNGPILVGTTTATGTASQQLQVTGGAYVSGNLGIGTTNPTSTLTVVGNASISGLTTTNNLYVTGVGTFQSSNLKIVGASTSFQYSIAGGVIAADRTLNLPVITATDTVAVLGLSQTFSAAQTFSAGLTATSTLTLSGSTSGTHVFGSNQTSGTLTFGGTSGTGAITLGRATTSQITNIQAGVTASGNTKTINFGTAGATGSFTQINIGPNSGVGTIAVQTGTNLLVGTTTATGTALQRLQVTGGAYVSGNLGIGTTNPITPLQVETYGVKTGVGTFTASVGVSTTLDSFSVSSTDFKIAEYTVHISFGSYIQAQKVLVTQDQSTAYSQEYGVVYNNTLLVSIGATISGGNCILQATPQTGVSGLTTYRFARNTLL